MTLPEITTAKALMCCITRCVIKHFYGAGRKRCGLIPHCAHSAAHFVSVAVCMTRNWGWKQWQCPVSRAQLWGGGGLLLMFLLSHWCSLNELILVIFIIFLLSVYIFFWFKNVSSDSCVSSVCFPFCCFRRFQMKDSALTPNGFGFKLHQTLTSVMV